MEPDDKARADAPARTRERLLAGIALILGLGALKLSYPVAMPALFALIVIMAAWPLRVWLARRLPGWLSTTLTVLALVALLIGFGWALFLASRETIGVLGAKWPDVRRIYAAATDQFGLPAGALDAAEVRRHITAFIERAVGSAYSIATYIGFIGILVIFGLPEAPRLSARLVESLGSQARRELVDVAHETSRQIRGYFAVMLFTSVLTGLGSAGIALLTGLDLATVWGLLNFLLNFVPVIGNIIGIIPPTIYAALQFGGVTMPIIVFAAFVVLQLTISNFVYPLLQGRQLAIAPVAIVLALAFWGWMWGIAGALIAVPLTAAILIVCEQFERTRWLAALIVREPPGRRWRFRDRRDIAERSSSAQSDPRA
jgi:predicted PurR-regulated permease PerM